jgi:hypothetical protein
LPFREDGGSDLRATGQERLGTKSKAPSIPASNVSAGQPVWRRPRGRHAIPDEGTTFEMGDFEANGTARQAHRIAAAKLTVDSKVE